MGRFAFALTIVVLLGGCVPQSPIPRSPADAALFAPVSMRIHPIFTDVKDWTGDGVPDGIEALLEFQDQFGDPTKASGSAIFELFTYRAYHADTRGERVVNPWLASVKTLAEQQARWNRTSRTYSFQLAYPEIREDRSYVLTASFDTGTTRFFDQMVLQGRNRPSERVPSTRPSAVIRPAATAPASPATTGAARDGAARP